MSSPQRRIKSAVTAKRLKDASLSPKKVMMSKIETRLLSDIQIYKELNETNIVTQNKEIEIERLQTTCVALNQRV